MDYGRLPRMEKRTQRLPLMMPPNPPQTIATRFAASLSDFVAQQEYQPLMRPAESEIRLVAAAAISGRNLGDGCRELLEVSGRALAKQAIAQTIRPILCGSATYAESAIELAMVLAIAVSARAQDLAVLFDFGNNCVFGDAEGDGTVRIQQQAPIQGYKADLLVSLQHTEEISGEVRVYFKQVAVECDGRDHHDLTQSQAEHDRERDRIFQASGLNVFRYTGSEIWADTFKCADGVLGYLKCAIKEQAEARKRSWPSKEFIRTGENSPHSAAAT
jgi:very-short-patch-repair endonuclease